MADKKTDSIKVSGKCEGDDIRTCKFRIRRVGKTVVAQGQQGLADALASVMDGHARRAKAAVGEPKLPYARPVPKQIFLYARTIEKHYMDSVVCDPKTIRVLKPEPNVLLYRCKLGGKWQTLKSIVNFTKVSPERRKRYFDDLNYWKADGVPVRIRKGSGVEPRLENPELTEIVEAMEKAEAVNE